MASYDFLYVGTSTSASTAEQAVIDYIEAFTRDSWTGTYRDQSGSKDATGYDLVVFAESGVFSGNFTSWSSVDVPQFIPQNRMDGGNEPFADADTNAGSYTNGEVQTGTSHAILDDYGVLKPQISFVNVTDNGSTASQTLTSASFTPSDDSLLLVVARCQAANHTTVPSWSVSDTETLTWTAEGESTELGDTNFKGTIKVWSSSSVGTSPASMTVTVDPYSTTDTGIISFAVYEIENGNTADVVDQIAFNDNENSGSLTLTLSTAPPNPQVWAWWGDHGASDTATWATPPAGLTSDAEDTGGPQPYEILSGPATTGTAKSHSYTSNGTIDWTYGVVIELGTNALPVDIKNIYSATQPGYTTANWGSGVEFLVYSDDGNDRPLLVVADDGATMYSGTATNRRAVLYGSFDVDDTDNGGDLVESTLRWLVDGISTTVDLDGDITTDVTLTGTVERKRYLEGDDVAVTSSFSAPLTLNNKMTADDVAISSTLTASMEIAHDLISDDVTTTNTLTGDIEITSQNMIGDVTSTATLTGDITIIHELTADNIPVTTALAGQLDAAPLEGDLATSSTLTGDMKVSHVLVADDISVGVNLSMGSALSKAKRWDGAQWVSVWVTVYDNDEWKRGALKIWDGAVWQG